MQIFMQENNGMEREGESIVPLLVYDTLCDVNN